PVFGFSRRRRHTRFSRDWSSDVCSSDLVAFADFMTAMMAFFLLLWILESTTREEQLAIAGYFRDPGSPYVVGPGGANAGVIELTQPKETASAKDSSTIPELSEDELRRQLEQAELE